MKNTGYEMITLKQGDCLDLMKKIPDESVDAIVTDPPYGKQWTRGINGIGLIRGKNEKPENLKWDKERMDTFYNQFDFFNRQNLNIPI